jgi:(2Fe-2S) ferredoxin
VSSRFRRHVFVCTNRRPGDGGGKPSCGERGGDAVLAGLVRAVAGDARLCGEVAVTGTQCLGPCFDGPTVVVYPEGAWYAGVAPGDVDELVREHLVEGRVVERLAYDWSSK